MKKKFKKNHLVITALALMIAVAGYLSYTERDLIGKKDLKKDVLADLSGEQYQLADDGTYDVSAEGIFTDEEEDTAKSITDDEAALIEDDEDVAAAEAENNQEQAVQGEVAQGETAEQEVAQGEATGQEVAQGEAAEQEVAQGENSDEGIQNVGEAVFTGSRVANIDYAADVKLSREQVRAQNKETLLDIINNTSIEEASKQDAINQMIALTDMAERENEAELLLEAKGFTEVVVSMSEQSVDVVLNMGEVTDAKRAQVEDIVKRKTGVAAENIVITPISVGEVD